MAKGNNTKAKIARVAWKLFHEKGYEETTIDEIILQSGTSKGSFYHYYSGKDELLASLPEIFDAKYEEVMQALDPEMDSFDKLMTLCFSVHDLIESDRAAGPEPRRGAAPGADYPQYAILRDCTYVCTLREGNHL